MTEPAAESPSWLGRFSAWLEEKLGWELPASVGWAHTLGAVLLFLLSSQLLTGFLLALYYCPAPDAARGSIAYIMEHVRCGRLVRGFHSWGASVAIALALCHMARVFWWGAFKAPRQATWLSGWLLFGCMLGLGFTGYLLPWDARGFFATQVASEIALSTPVAGPAARRMLLGGEGLGALTLTRFYAIHALLLPALLLLLGAGHVALVRRHGTTRRHDDLLPARRKFFPDHAWKDAAAALAVALGVGLLATFFPPDLDMAPEEAPPDYKPRPEWYFLPLFQLLHYFPGRWALAATHVLPGMAALLVLAWPWLERSGELDPEKRRGPILFAACGSMCVMALFGLGLKETRPWERPAPLKATAATVPEVEEARSSGDATRGKQLFAGLDCALCHEGGSGPDLSTHGSRSKRAWTESYLLAPHRIRWQKAGERPKERMPDFHLTRQEAADLALFLDGRRNLTCIPESKETPAPSALVAMGRSLFHQHRCGECHLSSAQGGPSGPDLAQAAERLKPDYIRALLTTPAKVLPNGAMKDIRLAPDEAAALAAYLAAGMR